MCFGDIFKRAPLTQLASILEQFTRNGIISENEARQQIGFKPSDDPEADKLTNSNIKQPGTTPEPSGNPTDPTLEEGEIQNGIE
jgi:hypothetical protein